jgi:hypothetical protein
MDASTDLPVMFRAGRSSGESPQHLAAAEAMPPDFGAEVTLLADCSEFQPNINDAAYLAWSKAIVIRAAYGDAHDDRSWFGGQRRELLHQGGAKFIGIYQYLVAGQDAAAQAGRFCALVGKLQPGEKLICDLEEGSGNQSGRWKAWAQAVRDKTGDEPWLYSGENFASVHGLAPVPWVAAYQNAEPAVTHRMWQFTDKFAVPGVGTCDCSVFHGTIGQLAALAHGGSQPAPPPASSWTETLLSDLPTLSAGAAGEDVASVQGLLAARGHGVNIDKAYGPVTRSAVMAFQHGKGLTADGVVGQQTWTKLLNR